MKPEKWTTLKGVAHLWTETPTLRGAPYLTSLCGQLAHRDLLQTWGAADRQCRRCFKTDVPSERDA